MSLMQGTPKPRRKVRTPSILSRIVEHKLMKRVSYKEYRNAVREKYDGPQGALLTTASMLSLHIPLGERLFRKRTFDLTGCRNILDVGSGAGQIAKHLLKYSDSGASVTCFDISFEMLRRARNRLQSDVPRQPRGRSFASAVRRRQLRLHHVRLRVGTPARPAAGPGGARARAGSRRPDAALGHGRQHGRGVYQPHVVLPDLQSPRIAPRLRRRRPAMEPRIVVHADA